jgi:hypothetical protein
LKAQSNKSLFCDADNPITIDSDSNSEDDDDSSEEDEHNNNNE